MGEDCRCHTTAPMAGREWNHTGGGRVSGGPLEFVINNSDGGFPEMLFAMTVTVFQMLSSR